MDGRRTSRLVTGIPAVLVAPAMMAGACGDGDDAGVPDESEVSGDLEVVINWTGSELEAFESVIEGFESEFSDVNVELVQVPFEEMNAQIPQQFSTGSAPDVTVGLPGLIRLLAQNDFLMPVDELWDEWVQDGMYTESLRDIASVDGSTYGVWFKANVNSLIWYRPDTFEQLGVQPPATWDEFTSLLERAQSEGTSAIAVGGSDGWPLTQWWDSILSVVAGPEAFTGLIDGSVGYDDERVVEAFEVFGDIVANYFPPDALDRGFVEATCAVMDGRAAIQNQGAFVNLVARGECDESLEPGTDYTFFKLPKFDENAEEVQFISGDLFVVNAETDNEPAAVALANYLGSAEAQGIWAELGGFVAPNADVSLDVYPTENDRLAAELWPANSGAVALYDSDDAVGGQIQTTLVSALQQFVGDQDVDRIVETMVAVDEEVRGDQ